MKAQGVGNIVRDLELRETGTGKKVLNFSVAFNRGYGKKKTTYFADFVAWEKTAEFIAKHFQKGEPIHIEEAEPNTEVWEKDGEKRYKTVYTARQVAFVPGKPKRDGEETPGVDFSKAAAAGKSGKKGKPKDEPADDSEIPF